LAWAREGNVLATRDDFCVRIWDGKRNRHLGSIVMLKGEQWLAVDAEGHYRASDREQFVHVVETERAQETLTPEVFARRYGWKNDPVRLFGP
jgi:hypothetical protein